MKSNHEMGPFLRAADPLRREPRMLDEDVERMRRAVLNASRREEPAGIRWTRALAVGALVALMVLAGRVAVWKPPVSEPAAGTKAAAAPAGTGERLQLQFATPGGTRVIWTLDPAFKVREVMP